MVLSQSLDDLGTTRGECLGRTRWSSLLDWTIYLYYFYKWLCTTSPWSHVLLECSTITWQGHVIWLLKFPCYLYLVFIVWLDICNQVFERMGNFFLLRALITKGCIFVPEGQKLHLQILCTKYDHMLAGHFGQSKTLSLVHREYYWPKL